MRATETLRVLRRDEGKAALLASIGVRFMVDGDRSGGGFALVEHPTPARALAAPLDVVREAGASWAFQAAETLYGMSVVDRG